ncbi:MAG: MFS transporter [Bdellovibrio sp. CG10_big_fil_rev_8_21_14_0_10_47_8]|nr:MAG: MFS transporter [Bdellovibrio sp. CG10_big_fil_rev_8_21_14_0_10_47_8]
MEKNQEILGHPKGLFVLFFTEMWERFSYYGMRALLILYMTQYLFQEVEKGKEVFGFSVIRAGLEAVSGPLSNQALSSQIYGFYTGLVYFTPFFGGIIADRMIGQRKSVYIGGILMSIGHFLMAIESLFFPALLFLIFGNGFFKPNISTQVGGLYAVGDHRRDRAFTIFYMGINLGAFFSPLVCGTLGQKMGWHYGFGAAGVGMLIGLLVYHFGRKHLPAEAKIQPIQRNVETGGTLSKEDKTRIVALIFICTLTVLFWGVYEQQGNTLQLWADEYTDWNILGFEMPSTWFQSFNPFIIFLMAPVMDLFWGWQSRRGSEPSSVGKMALGCFLAAMAFVLMVINAKVVGPGEKSNVIWLIGMIFMFTLGELYLSPIGLSLVTKLAPARMVSMLMGVWFFASFLGNSLAGYIGGYYEKLGTENFFYMLTVLAVSAGVMFLAALKPLKKVVVD